MKLPDPRAAAVAALLLSAGLLYAAQSVELSADTTSSVEKTATSRDVALVLPTRFLRSGSDSQFSTPYIAELYYTIDSGKTWKSYRIFKDLDKPLTFSAEAEGRYGFFVTLWDEKGGHDVVPSASTPPQVTILFDWTPPDVALTAPAGGEVIGGGKAFDIKWTAADAFMAEKPITLEYSADDGATWQVVAKGVENSGTFAWMPAPNMDGRALVRVTAVDEAGHATSAVTRSPVIIDTCPPTAALLGPTLSAGRDVHLEVKADDGAGSGVALIDLWSSADSGATWSPAGKATAGQALVFHGAAGTYGLYATATDKAGNVGPRPSPGQAPQITLTIDDKTPIVRLKTLTGGGCIAGGSRTPVEWEAIGPNPVERPVSIYLSPDGGNSWAPVAADVANTGTIVWEVPAINSSNCLLKVAFRDASGAVGSAESAKPFTIDSTRPTSVIGLAPGAAQQPLGDLSKVIAPVACTSAAAPATTAEVSQPYAASAEAPAILAAQPVESTGGQIPAPGDLPSWPIATTTPAGLPEGTQYAPETTPAPNAAWTAPKEEPNALAIGKDASFDEVMKAAFAAYKAGQMPIAKDYFTRAAAMSPGDPRPHASLGRIHAREGSFNYTSRKQAFEAALYEFEKAISLNGGDADVYNDMGFVLLETQRLADAAKAFRKATEIGARPLYWYNLGLACYRQNDIANASTAFSKALEMDDSMENAAFYMGKISMSKGDWKAAKIYWTKAVDGYGPDSDMGKIALSGLQTAREKLGEVSPEPGGASVRQALDRIR